MKVLAVIFLFGAFLLMGLGALVSGIYNVSALLNPNFDMDAQANPWFGFWVAVYCFIPGAILALLASAFGNIREGRAVLLALVAITIALNLLAYFKTLL